MQATEAPAVQFLEVPLSHCRESSWNPRRHYDDAKLEELADSIREKGVIEPIIVRPLEGPGAVSLFEIVAGSRRFRASMRADRETIHAIVRALSDVEALELAVIENGQRDDVHPLDEADGYRALLKVDPHYTVGVVAAKVGKSESYVYRRMKLTDLIADVKAAFEHDRITIAHAERLSRLTPSLQEMAFNDVVFRDSPLFNRGRNQDEQPTAADLAPLHDLDAFIRSHTAFKPSDESTRHFIPEIAEDLAEAETDAPTSSLLELSDDAFVASRLGLKPGDKAIPLNRHRWKDVKGADACPHAQRGVVTHGGPARVIWVCATKGCPKHFPVSKAKKATKTTAAQPPARNHFREQEDAQRREREAWETMRPAAAAAFARHVRPAKLNAALVKILITPHELKGIQETFGVELTDRTAAQVLALDSVQTYNRHAFTADASRYGFDFKAFEKGYQAQVTAKGKSALAASRATLAKKRPSAPATRKAKGAK